MSKVLASLSVIILAISAYAAWRPDSCDGIPREMGGCDRDRPVFVGSTCDEVAVEWGEQLDGGAVAVIDGPANRGDLSQSVMLHNMETVTSQLANKHLRDNGLTPQCEVERFFSIGEAQFSDHLKASVGKVMYQGNPETDYEEWRERAEGWIELILGDPYAPY